jgi:hypothetical protein
MNKTQLICRFLPAYYEELFYKILYINVLKFLRKLNEESAKVD